MIHILYNIYIFAPSLKGLSKSNVSLKKNVFKKKVSDSRLLYNRNIVHNFDQVSFYFHVYTCSYFNKNVSKKCSLADFFFLSNIGNEEKKIFHFPHICKIAGFCSVYWRSK